MAAPSPDLSVHVLIDLEWKAESGGHVACWQRLGAAAAAVDGLQLTLHAQGEEEEVVTLGGPTRLWLHKPVFSTRKIPFLHAPAHTDLAGFHPALASALEGADVIHTTDGFFAYAKTAEKVAREKKIPLTHSVHTDTVRYSRLFAREFFSQIAGGAGRAYDSLFGISKGIGKNMARKLFRHQAACRFVLVARPEDRTDAESAVGHERVKNYRLGLDSALFSPSRRDRETLLKLYHIPQNAVVVLFVGRLDVGKNIHLLIEGMARAIKNGAPLFLVAAGLGPAEKIIHEKLPGRAATPGFLSPEELSIAYASADWLALPSTVETWSLVAEEALASGLPVIASPASGVGRFLGAEGAGLLVTHDSPVAWEAALMEACGLRDTERLRHLSRNAALAQFPSWQEALMQDFLPVWQEAAKKS